MLLKLTIPGEPTGKGRARTGKWGTYTPEKTVNYETLVKEMFAVTYPDHKPWLGPVAICISCHYSIPASTSKKKKEMMLTTELLPLKKPDLSNVLKIIEDALNKIAYNDDSQIVGAQIYKKYSETPKVEIILTEVTYNESEQV